jgi:hypothetical protein
MNPAAILFLSLCLLLGACSKPDGAERIPVAGGDAGGVPLAQPAEEHFDAAALAKAADDPAAAGLQVFVVMRHGHIVFERFGHGIDGDSVVAPKGFTDVLVALAAGIAEHDDLMTLSAHSAFDANELRRSIEAGSHLGYTQYLSAHLWRRLNAGPAWIDARPGQPVAADCCFHARIVDWLRLGDLLVEDGQFEGKQVVPAGWVARMRRPVAADGAHGFGILLPAAVRGGEPAEAKDLFFVGTEDHWRLWLMPDLRVAVLFGGGAGGAAPWDELRLPNLVVRALSEPASVDDGASKLKGLVPGH